MRLGEAHDVTARIVDRPNKYGFGRDNPVGIRNDHLVIAHHAEAGMPIHSIERQQMPVDSREVESIQPPETESRRFRRIVEMRDDCWIDSLGMRDWQHVAGPQHRQHLRLRQNLSQRRDNR